MTAGAQATFVVEYPCEQFCRIEVDLRGERSQLTLQQMQQKADVTHQRTHEPKPAETDVPIVDPEPAGRPAATVFLAAPGRGGNRRR